MTPREWFRRVSIFPLKPKSKIPALSSWKAYMDRRPTDEERDEWRRKHPGCNWGMACGPASGYVVLDFDGVQGQGLLKQYELDVDDPETGPPRVVTAKGTHLYYAWPGGSLGEVLKNWVSPVPGLDVRTRGGYVVIPPSVHPESGAPYKWAVAPWEREAPPLPEWFLDLANEALIHGVPEAQQPEPLPDRDGEPMGQSPWEILLEQPCVQGTVAGGRHGRAAKLAGLLLNKFKPPVALQMLRTWNTARCKPPLEDRDLQKLIADFAKTRQGFPQDDEPKPPCKGWTAKELLSQNFAALNTYVDPWFREGDNIIICGETGVGKSFVAGAMAFALALGVDFYGFRVPGPVPVVIVDIENGERRLQTRMARLAAHHSAAPENLKIYSFRRGLDLGSAAGMNELSEITEGYKVVILDPFLPFFPAIRSENDNAEVRRALDNIAVWAEKRHQSLVVVDHAPALSSLARKGGEKAKPRGATAKKDWAATCMALMGGLPVTLHWTKTRDCKPPEPIDLEFDGAMLRAVQSAY